MRIVPVLLLAVACGESEPECTSDEATVHGTVTVSAPQAGDPTVYLYTAAGDLVAQTTPDADGHYEFVTDGGGDYVVTASYYDELSSSSGGGGRSCYSEDVPVTLAPCDDLTVDLDVGACETADKPNLYLYPSTDVATTVTLHHDARQDVFASVPPYGSGWTGTAHPDGTFTPTGGETAPFLFYEISLLPAQSRALQGGDVRCVAGPHAERAMADLLGEYGFTARERADFVNAWATDLPVRPSYTVRAVRDVGGVVGVDIRPPLPLERIWLVVSDGTGCVPSPGAVAPMTRGGAHAVEWGVVLRDLR